MLEYALMEGTKALVSLRERNGEPGAYSPIFSRSPFLRAIRIK